MGSKAMPLKFAPIVIAETGPIDHVKDKVDFNELTMLSFEIE